VSEALLQKLGTNDNTLDAEATTDQTNIANNTTDIATNTATIATGIPVFFTLENLQLTGSFQTIFTFASTPTNVIVQYTPESNQPGVTMLNTAQSVVTTTIGAVTIIWQINGVNLEARSTGGSPLGTDDFIGWGFL